LRVS